MIGFSFDEILQGLNIKIDVKKTFHINLHDLEEISWFPQLGLM
jgi:hypothetical protein